VFIMAHRRSEGLQRCGRLEQIRLSVKRKIEERHSSKSSGFGSQIWPSRPGQPQYTWEPPRVVANARCGERVGGQIVKGAVCAGEGELGKAGESMGNASNERCGGLDDEPSQISNRETRGHADGTSTEQQQEQRQTEPALGRDTNGPTSGLDDAELCESCDNRTDELRLLGNGVVPATAELAFRTLFNELHKNRSVTNA
jgi:hypothetical protein